MNPLEHPLTTLHRIDAATARRLRRQADELAAVEARLTAARRAGCPADERNAAMVRQQRERIELQLERLGAPPRDDRTLPLFEVNP